MAENKPKEIRRKEILEAGLKCFAEKGYNGTRINDITEEAKITRGGLYWHFNSKWEIFKAIFENHIKQSEEIWKQLNNIEINQKTMQTAGIMFIEYIVNNELMIKIKNEIENEALRNEEIRKDYQILYDKMDIQMKEFLKKLNKTMNFKKIDFDSLSCIIEILVIGICKRFLISDKKIDYKKIWNTFCETISFGIIK